MQIKNIILGPGRMEKREKTHLPWDAAARVRSREASSNRYKSLTWNRKEGERVRDRGLTMLRTTRDLSFLETVIVRAKNSLIRKYFPRWWIIPPRKLRHLVSLFADCTLETIFQTYLSNHLFNWQFSTLVHARVTRFIRNLRSANPQGARGSGFPTLFSFLPTA